MSDPKSYLRTEDGQRIDQPDFQHAVERSQLNGLTQLGDSVLVGVDRTRAASGDPAQPRHYVLEGFEVRAQASGTLVEVDGGVALLGYRHNHQVQYGMVSSSQTMQLHDVSAGLLNPTEPHTIWVRAALSDDDVGNRAFWNSAGAPPVEIVRSLPTRKVEKWQIMHTEGDWQVGAPSPGEEWMPIATVIPSTMTVTRTRVFFFEGRESANFTIGDEDWGVAPTPSTLDRSPDRATNGVFGLRRWVMAVNRQLQDIIHSNYTTPAEWHSAILSTAKPGRSLSELVDQKLNHAGRSAPIPGINGRMTGHLDPDSNDALDLGFDDPVTPRRWRSFLGRALSLGESALSSSAAALLPRITARFASAAGRNATLLAQSWSDASAVPDGTTQTVYRMQSGPGGQANCTAVASNCFYDNDTDMWDRYDAAVPSTVTVFSAATALPLAVYHHDNLDVGQVNPWPNANGSATANFLRALRTTAAGAVDCASNLTAAGNVYANGGHVRVDAAQHFQWQGSRTFIKSIPAIKAAMANFGGAGSNGLGINLTSTFTVAASVTKVASVSAAVIAWPVEPINGALLTGLRVSATFTPAGAGEIVAALVEIPNNGGAGVILASATPSGGPSEHAIFAGNVGTVATDGFSYYIIVSATLGSTFEIWRWELDQLVQNLELP